MIVYRVFYSYLYRKQVMAIVVKKWLNKVETQFCKYLCT